MTGRSDDELAFERKRRRSWLLFWLAMAFALACSLGSLAVAFRFGVLGADGRAPLAMPAAAR